MVLPRELWLHHQTEPVFIHCSSAADLPRLVETFLAWTWCRCCDRACWGLLTVRPSLTCWYSTLASAPHSSSSVKLSASHCGFITSLLFPCGVEPQMMLTDQHAAVRCTETSICSYQLLKFLICHVLEASSTPPPPTRWFLPTLYCMEEKVHTWSGGSYSFTLLTAEVNSVTMELLHHHASSKPRSRQELTGFAGNMLASVEWWPSSTPSHWVLKITSLNIKSHFLFY